MASPAWWWPPQTRPPCRIRPPGTSPPTCPACNPRQAASAHPQADLAEIVRIYGIRHWIEQSYKQVKDEISAPDFQVRSDTAIRRHQALVNCAFCFCWDAWFHDHPTPATLRNRGQHPAAERRGPQPALPPPTPSWPRALRAISAWLPPSIALQRWW
jgi:hypothetical protein